MDILSTKDICLNCNQSISLLAQAPKIQDLTRNIGSKLWYTVPGRYWNDRMGTRKHLKWYRMVSLRILNWRIYILCPIFHFTPLLTIPLPWCPLTHAKRSVATIVKYYRKCLDTIVKYYQGICDSCCDCSVDCRVLVALKHSSKVSAFRFLEGLSLDIFDVLGPEPMMSLQPAATHQHVHDRYNTSTIHVHRNPTVRLSITWSRTMFRRWVRYKLSTDISTTKLLQSKHEYRHASIQT